MRTLVAARNAAVGIEGGEIVAPTGRFEIEIHVADGLLLPGLINAHDHLHRNHYGRLGEPPYANAYDWGRDIHARAGDAIARGRAVPRRAALLCGAWKNLLAGVTTVVHHDPWETNFDEGFPIRVVPLRVAHSLGFDSTIDGEVGPLAVHVAEGVDRLSADEVRDLAGRGWLTGDLLAVHAVGVDSDGIERLRASGAAVVWCPTSNLFLFGQTAPAALLTSGVDVLLGSDSLLTGRGALLDELADARRLDIVSEQCLLDAVGSTAARRLRVPAPSLDEGARADLVVLRQPLFEAGARDVAAVIVAGIVRVLAPDLVNAMAERERAGRWCEVNGVRRWICERADGAR